MSKMLDSFIQQTYGSLEKARESDKQADLNPNAYVNAIEGIGNPELAKMADDEAQKEAMKGHFGNPSIKDSMSIPTKLKDGSIDQKTDSHANFKGYKHDLETSRSQKLGLIRIRDMPTGDVENLFDNMFNDDSNIVE